LPFLLFVIASPLTSTLGPVRSVAPPAPPTSTTSPAARCRLLHVGTVATSTQHCGGSGRTEQLLQPALRPRQHVTLRPVPGVDVGAVGALLDDPPLVALAHLGHSARRWSSVRLGRSWMMLYVQAARRSGPSAEQGSTLASSPLHAGDAGLLAQRDSLTSSRCRAQAGCSARWACTRRTAVTLARTRAGRRACSRSCARCWRTAAATARSSRWARSAWTTTGAALPAGAHRPARCGVRPRRAPAARARRLCSGAPSSPWQ